MAQRNQLRRLLLRARDTVWGQERGYDDLARSGDCVRAFQHRVPLCDYSAVQPYVDRMLRGEPDVLWPGRIRDFALSSGTVSEGKLLPLSPQMLRTIRRATLDVVLNYVRVTGHVEIALGSLLSLSGSVGPLPHHPGVRAGVMSGFIADQAPSLAARYWQATSGRDVDAPNWARKLDLIVERTLDTDIRALTMVPTWGPVLFRKLLAAYADRHRKPVDSVLDVWSNLQVIFSGGAPLDAYRDLLEDQLGDVRQVDFMDIYGASEGFFAMQTHPDDKDLLLRLDTGVFYEFVRMEDQGKTNPRRYTVADVSTGIPYAVYVSTCSGLWAYAVRDVVRFTSTAPLRLVVVGRTCEMIDGHGERVFAEEARAALRETCARTNAVVAEFHVAPAAPEEDPPTHQWLIEFRQAPEDLRAFAGALDEALGRRNRFYRTWREGRAFGQPLVEVVPSGTFHAWLQRTREQVSAQSKIPQMRGDRTIAESIIEQARSRTMP